MASQATASAGGPHQDTKRFTNSIKHLIWRVNELEHIVQHFGQDSQPVLEDKLYQFANAVQDLSSWTYIFDDVKVPLDLLRYMDDGGNPNQWTAEIFKACLRDNQASKGRIMAVQSLRDNLLQELEQQAPEHTAEYKRLLAAHAENGAGTSKAAEGQS